MSDVAGRGIRWNANRMSETPQRPGVYIVFNDADNTCEIASTSDLLADLRKRWWHKNFWYFSWFEIHTECHRFDIEKKLKKLSYNELWDFKA